jgi:uncharacterized protein (TIGR02646 family)
MRQIKKQPESADFTLWKQANEAKINQFITDNKTGKELWSLLPSSLGKEKNDYDYSKAQLRNELVKEQHFICCYCNESIKGEALDTKIDHFLPKEVHKEKTFVYENLFAACMGGENIPAKPKVLHCDSFKDGSDPSSTLIISPLQDNVDLNFSYTENGEIKGITEIGKRTIEFLNLDCKRLNIRRKDAIEAYLYDEEIDFETSIDNILTPIDGKLEPFCMAIIFVLKCYL